jgi:hypothetical protein
MTKRLRRAIVITAVAALARPVGAQEIGSAVFVRSFRFDPGIGARRVTQWGVPVVAQLGLGRRLTVTVTGAWASTELASHDGWTSRFTGLTDAQARLSYVLGRDVAIVTFEGNLPVGTIPSTVDRAVTGATASSMLAFPVTRFRGGPAATGAIAVARRLGGTSLGFGAGLRWAGGFQPVRDETSRFSPALEGRAHVSANGLLFGGRLGVSVTASTFTTDEFIRTAVEGATGQSYRPGRRVILEAGYVAPLGRQTLGLGTWLFVNGAPRDSIGQNTGSREVITNLSALLAVPVGSSIIVTPRAEWRRGAPDGGTADQLLAAQLEWTLLLGLRTRLLATGRYDTGQISSEATGVAVSTRGFGLTVGLRLRN